MGTRAVTNIFDRETHLVTIYRQSDGYLSGHGKDIVDAFAGRKFVNGFAGRYRNKCINGMGCAAALLISWLKQDHECGLIYIAPPDPSRKEEYTYTIAGDTMDPKSGMRITVTAYGKTLYDGLMSEFDPVAIELEQSDD